MPFLFASIVATGLGWVVQQTDAQPLPGTQALAMEGDIASHLVDGVDRFLLGEIEKSAENRGRHWKRDLSSSESYNRSIELNRKRLAHILGMRDPRVPSDGPELVATPKLSSIVGRSPDGGKQYVIHTVRWPAFADVHGEGLLVEFLGAPARVNVVAIPDADQTPEQILGLVEGVPPESQFARRLADAGCRVIIPTLIDRKLERRNGRANLTSREFLYRSAFELGRHLIGYEMQKVLAAVDWFDKDSKASGISDPLIGVVGYGEGGMLALYAGALDTRIDATCVSGYFGDRNGIWQQPIDRNVVGLLDEFGDAELASMIAPRHLTIEVAKGPELTLPSEGGAPAQLVTPEFNDAQREFDRARQLAGPLASNFELIDSRDADGNFCTAPSLRTIVGDVPPLGAAPESLIRSLDPTIRHARQMHEIDRHNQRLLVDSPYVRTQFMNIGLPRDDRPDGSNKLDTSSPEAYAQSVERFRKVFRDEVIGRFDLKPLPFNARTRKAYDSERWTGYEVALDVFPDVIAYGVLLVPKDLKLDGSERRPVVVCQHGLEGRPRDTIQTDLDGVRYYSAFAAKLAERGFITFAPQNLYIFQDRFRTLQRKANPLGKTLFSIMVPQHQQITDWLKSLPYVDPERIAFYGLSYGGKSAMRIPPLVSNYCLSICSADFNEWVWKNASSHTRNYYTYVWTGEYEIFEFDLGSTFNYAEMAALIAPRPFMVERGHFDGVAPDETVGYEFAKVFHLYNARLHIGDRCEIEWFAGPHTINGKGTFEFLHKHLMWPKRE